MITSIKKIIRLCSCTALLAAGSCSDNILSELTSLEVSRLFSPVGLEARVVDQTSARLTWQAVGQAQTYDVEFFANGNQDFSGTPQKTVTGVTFEQLPLIVPGLDGETAYSVRVKAVGPDIDDSKWVSATFTTDAEQIFRPVDPDELTATSVTLRWPAGQTATSIVLSPGGITHTITAEEIAAGATVIGGLTGETTYTARLMNGTRTRGTVTFTTLIDLGGAIAVTPEDDLMALLAAAGDGDVFALLPGEYTINDDITISKSIGIKGARPSDKPVLKGVIFRPSAGASLELSDLLLDGTGSKDGNQTVIYAAGTFGALKISNSVIHSYIKGILYVNNATHIESVIYSGNIIYDIECNGGDFIDLRNGIATTFDFMNNTVYNSALARDFFRMDGGGSTNFPGIKSIITIQNNTFNNVSNGNSRRMLYIRLASHEIRFNRNILANTEGYYSNQGATTITQMTGNNYHNAPNFTGSTQSNAKNDTGPYTTFNPGFPNAAGGDFRVNHEELKLNGIGDPRWIN